MNNDNSRSCSKCKKALMEDEAFCTYCGKLSGTPTKGTIIIKADKTILLIIASLMIGVLLLITGIFLNAKYVNKGTILIGLAISFITLGIALINAYRQFLNKSKEANTLSLADTGEKHCKYCNKIVEKGYIHCNFCGSKIK